VKDLLVKRRQVKMLHCALHDKCKNNMFRNRANGCNLC